MVVKVKQIVEWMNEWAPPSLAEPDDKVGLLIGSLNEPISRIAVALDVTEAVVDEAIERKAGLIIAHHPIIFRPLSSIRTDITEGRIIQKLLKHNISVFAAHTNLDVAEGGVNDLLADVLGLQQPVPLAVTMEERLYKLAVYVPHSHAVSLQDALFSAGAGHIGKYSHCGFSISGTGTFLPEDGANPFLGEQGRVEQVEEKRIETVVPESRKNTVLQAMFQAHPYEEVAYDLYLLNQPGKRYGLGRIGILPEPMDLESFALLAKRALGVSALRYVGDGRKMVRKVAVLGGSGRSFMKRAIAAGADVYVTGDLDHHTAHDALAAGLALVDPGHHVEQLMKQAVASRWNAYSAAEGFKVDAYASEPSTEPFRFV